MSGEIKNEHFVSKFHLNYFTGADGMLDIYDKKIHKAWKNKPASMFYEVDAYEVKNLDGSYFHRNLLERLIKGYEDKAAEALKNYSAVKPWSYEFSTEEVFALVEYMAWQLNRYPEHRVKFNLATRGYDSCADREEAYRNAAYLMAMVSPAMAYEYLERNGFSFSDEDKRRYAINSVFETSSEYILKHYVPVFMVSESDTLIICDKPVLVGKIGGIQYFMPLTKKMALACAEIENPLDLFNFGTYCEFSEECPVDGVNRLMFHNADRWVVCNREAAKRYGSDGDGGGENERISAVKGEEA